MGAGAKFPRLRRGFKRITAKGGRMLLIRPCGMGRILFPGGGGNLHGSRGAHAQHHLWRYVVQPYIDGYALG